MNKKGDENNELTGLFANFLSIVFDNYPQVGIRIFEELAYLENFQSENQKNLSYIIEEVKTETRPTINITKFYYENRNKGINVRLPTESDLRLKLLSYLFDLTCSKIEFQLKLDPKVEIYL